MLQIISCFFTFYKFTVRITVGCSWMLLLKMAVVWPVKITGAFSPSMSRKINHIYMQWVIISQDTVFGYFGFGLVARLLQTTYECDNSKSNGQYFNKICRSLDISMSIIYIFRWLCVTIQVLLRGQERSNFEHFWSNVNFHPQGVGISAFINITF